MVSKHDPVESFLNSLHAVELGLRRATEDLQAQWSASGSAAGRVFHFCGQDGSCRPEKRRQRSEVVAGNRATPVSSARSEWGERGSLEGDGGSCVGCVEIPVRWSRLLDGFVRAFPRAFESGKKRLQKQSDLGYGCSGPFGLKAGCEGSHRGCGVEIPDKPRAATLELFACCVFDGLVQTLQIFDKSNKEGDAKPSEKSGTSSTPLPFDHMKMLAGIVEGRKGIVDGFLSNMKFARVRGPPGGLVEVTSSVKDEAVYRASGESREDPTSNSLQKFTTGLLSIPLSNVERLRSTLSTVSLTELIEFVPQLGRSPKEHPDKRKLISVQDFFRYTQSEGMPLRLLHSRYFI